MVSLSCVRFKVCVFKFGDTVVLTGLLWGFCFSLKSNAAELDVLV